MSPLQSAVVRRRGEEETRARWRPELRPRLRWERVALVLILVFTLLRGLAWASSQPGWFAPDEDYHWLYTEHLITKHSLPDLKQPFYTSELYGVVAIINRQGNYALGARRRYTGKPHAAVVESGLFVKRTRPPTGQVPRPVLHPPLYYVGAYVTDRALGERSAITRLTLMRYYSVALGVLAVFLAWVLAAQVLALAWQRLAVPALLATQPIVAFSSSTLTNDVGVLVTFTAATAWLAWMLRSEPGPVQGWGLGGVIAAGALVKATSLSLLPLAGIVLAWLWLSRPGHRAAVRGIALRAAGVFAVVALPWYVHLHSVTGSFLGDRSEITRAPAGTHGFGIGHLPHSAYDWLASVYPTYWFDYNGFEVDRSHDAWYYLPLVIGGIGLAGLLVWALGVLRRRVRARSGSPEAAQAALMLLANLALLVPFMYVDVLREQRGLGFIVQQGRFVTPAYAGVCVLFLIGLRTLTRDHPRWYPAAAGVAVAASLVSYLHTYARWGLERFYGAFDGHYLRALERAAYDKPDWVSQGFFAVCLVGAVACFVAAGVVAVVAARTASTRE
jgi:hypothetical protein